MTRRTRLIYPRTPVWFWIISAYAIAIAFGASFNKPTSPCVEVCEVRE